MHLSSVDLPEPLWPRMPTVSPSSIVAVDVVQRLELDVARAGAGGGAAP